MTYTDVFDVTHDDCTIVQTQNDFNRIFIIENKQGVRFTCVKEGAPKSPKVTEHWKHAKPGDSSAAHPFRNNFK